MLVIFQILNPKSLIVNILISTLLSCCTTPTKLSHTNLAKLYRKGSTLLHPEFIVYHHSDSTSVVYYKVATDELLYTKKDNETDFTARLVFDYKLVESYESDIIADSSTMEIDDVQTDEKKTNLTGFFVIRATCNKRYVLQITAVDVYRNQSSYSYIDVDKTSPLIRQNFLITKVISREPVFRYAISGEDSLRITYKNAPAGKRSYSVRYYNRDYPVAAPPFSLAIPEPFNFYADSLFPVFMSDSNTTGIRFIKKGIYHLQADSFGREGLTLLNLGKSYPKVTSLEELTQPLRYITTRDEFSDMLNNADRKEAIDKFWLRIAYNPERAKELIRQYYTRVQDANEYFTSYMEGWKTDRGMVYIVFGPPNALFKSSDHESWIYGEENNYMSINFVFQKVINPFTDNDFMLNRSPIYKVNYYKAVDSWRDGRVIVN